MKLELCCAALAAAVTLSAFQSFGQIATNDVKTLDAVIAGWQPAPSAKKAKVLLFSKCFGYNHKAGRCYGDDLIAKAGARRGIWDVHQETNAVRLGDSAYLAGYDAIVLNNSTQISEKSAPGVTAALTNFLAQGKGIAIVHAGLDSFKDSQTLQGTFGGYFDGHPWHVGGSWKFKNEQPEHPLMAPFKGFGATFNRKDEIYQFLRHFDRAKCKVLVSLDLSDPATKKAEQQWAKRCGPGSTRADHDYGVSWVKQVGPGRVFYTSFGHDQGAFLDAARAHHVLLGVQYAVGDIAY